VAGENINVAWLIIGGGGQRDNGGGVAAMASWHLGIMLANISAAKCSVNKQRKAAYKYGMAKCIYKRSNVAYLSWPVAWP